MNSNDGSRRAARHCTRREWLTRTAGTSLAVAAGARSASALSRVSRSAAGLDAVQDGAFMVDDPRVQALMHTGVDAARAAGATYADARLTYQRYRAVDVMQIGGDPMLHEGETIAVGVRALVNGYWGFAGSSVYTTDEVARLGHEATTQARTNARSLRRVVDLAPTPVVRNATWRTPMVVDPFNVSFDEMLDYLLSFNIYGSYNANVSLGGLGSMDRREQAFASSDGSSWNYVTTNCRGAVMVGDFEIIDMLPGKTGGWECIRDVPVRDILPSILDQYAQIQRLPGKVATSKRTDVVIGAMTLGNIAQQTLLQGTELDRALGYEANATGTSYISDPIETLGSPVAGAHITLRGDRTFPGGSATVPWDDDGVAATEFDLVRDGVLVDFQTTRESASWLASWYATKGRPVRSNGCAKAVNGLYAPLQLPPNFSLEPTGTAQSVDELLQRVSDGIFIDRATSTLDYQGLNGVLRGGRAFEIKQGKRVARLAGYEIEFRAPQFWTAIQEVGGPGTVRRIEGQRMKGQPEQNCGFSGRSVPGLIKNLLVRGQE